MFSNNRHIIPLPGCSQFTETAGGCELPLELMVNGKTLNLPHILNGNKWNTR